MNERSYNAGITVKRPSAFIFMIDQSGSMEEKLVFNNELMSKASSVSFIINDILKEILNRSKRESGYKDYFDIAILGYGGDSVTSLLPRSNIHEFFSRPSELALTKTDIVKTHKYRVMPDGRRVVTMVENKEWIKPRHLGKTPMYAAMQKAYKLANEWIKNHSHQINFPPIVINITDGEATDATNQELLAIADRIKLLKTLDGNVLLFNIHLSSDSSTNGIMFPQSYDQLPDKPYAKLLFDMSSYMPDLYKESMVEITGKPSCENCKAMSYNSTITQLLGMLSIGSISVNFLE